MRPEGHDCGRGRPLAGRSSGHTAPARARRASRRLTGRQQQGVSPPKGHPSLSWTEPGEQDHARVLCTKCDRPSPEGSVRTPNDDRVSGSCGLRHRSRPWARHTPKRSPDTDRGDCSLRVRNRTPRLAPSVPRRWRSSQSMARTGSEASGARSRCGRPRRAETPMALLLRVRDRRRVENITDTRSSSVEHTRRIGTRAIGFGRFRKSERHAWRAAADYCFQRWCLQPNGPQLAIRPALLLATSRCFGTLGPRPAFMLARTWEPGTAP